MKHNGSVRFPTDIKTGQVLRHVRRRTRVPVARYAGEYEVVTGGVLLKVSFHDENGNTIYTQDTQEQKFAWWNMRNCVAVKGDH